MSECECMWGVCELVVCASECEGVSVNVSVW